MVFTFNMTKLATGQETALASNADSKLSVLVRVSLDVTKHHDQKANWAGKGLFALHFSIAIHH